MTTKTAYVRKQRPSQNRAAQPGWQRVILLIVLGYESAGCLLGGTLLVAAPDGSYMDMPVDLMRGVFPDFLIPGILLLGLGILNTAAFVSVLRKTRYDWIMSVLALGGLFIWFIVEILILKELHWLHAMWGLPVLMGCVVTVPLIGLRRDKVLTRKAMLTFGIISSLWYVAVNIFVPLLDEGYSAMSMTVSELSALGASTRIEWVLLVTPYPLLLATFGWGVFQSAANNRHLRLAGGLIIVYSLLNFYWPPMHQREVIAAGGGTLTDSLHIVWAVMTLLFNLLLMGFGAAALGKRFRLYTIVTWAVFIVFGVLTFVESPGIEKNLPTPHIGLWERSNIAVFLLWITVFASVLLQADRLSHSKSLSFKKAAQPSGKTP